MLLLEGLVWTRAFGRGVSLVAFTGEGGAGCGTRLRHLSTADVRCSDVSSRNIHSIIATE